MDKQIEVIKQLNRGELKFSSKAFKKYCYINFALAQTIFRQLTNEEKEKVNYLINYYNL